MHAGQGMFDLKTVDVTAPPVPGQKKPPLLPLITSDAADWNGEVSPDGRWLVFQSRRSGQDEIYVTPYPKTGDGLWLVSSAGGSRPAWSRDGRELFYLDLENRLTVVSVQTSGQAFVAGTPKRLLDTAYYPGFTPAGVPLRGYDVSPDGKRFLMIKEASGESGAPPPKITVVVNLQEELKRLLPER
jgi:serine/threonine-protein kinase